MPGPALTINAVLAGADAHRARTCLWTAAPSGPFSIAPPAARSYANP
jgi:hypothetical protein